MKLIIPKFWQKKTFISFILIPISYAYDFISSKLRYIQKDKIYKTKAKIITVGNITMGGAGKTPTSLSLAEIIKNSLNTKVAILSKGYKGKLLGPIMVNENHNITDVGDEALLFFKNFPTCVSKNRLEGIKFLENLGYETIITDDGFHDQRFTKYLNIMVVDGDFLFGNELIFPAGPLRQSISSGIKEADIIVLIGENKINYQWPENATILKAKLVSDISLNHLKFIAFAGIGNPNKFFTSVTKANGDIIKKIVFPDHYHYNQRDIENLIKTKEKYNVDLITTEKDYNRIDFKYQNQIKTLPIKLAWEDQKIILEKISNI